MIFGSVASILKYAFSFKVKPNKKPQVPFKNWHIVRGDVVKVRSGADRGKVGKVLKVYRRANAVIVKGVNMRDKQFSNNYHNTYRKSALTNSYEKTFIQNSCI